jgi:hypothetical protein
MLAPKQTRASATSETAAKCEGEGDGEQVGTNGRPPTEYWQDCEHGEIPDATLPAHATTRATTASDVPLTLCAILINL